jgi:hypothetical protein
MKCVGLQQKVQRQWVREGTGGGKMGEVKQIHSKDTASLNGTSFNHARKGNPFVNK